MLSLSGFAFMSEIRSIVEGGQEDYFMWDTKINSFTAVHTPLTSWNIFEYYRNNTLPLSKRTSWRIKDTYFLKNVKNEKLFLSGCCGNV